jgi:hypothetical protein
VASYRQGVFEGTAAGVTMTAASTRGRVARSVMTVKREFECVPLPLFLTLSVPNNHIILLLLHIFKRDVVNDDGSY